MGRHNLTAAEIAIALLQSDSGSLSKNGAGALRSLEGDRGLPEGLGKHSVGAHRLDVLERLAFAAASLLAVAGLCFAVLGVMLLLQTLPFLGK